MNFADMPPGGSCYAVAAKERSPEEAGAAKGALPEGQRGPLRSAKDADGFQHPRATLVGGFTCVPQQDHVWGEP